MHDSWLDISELGEVIAQRVRREIEEIAGEVEGLHQEPGHLLDSAIAALNRIDAEEG